jgi:putative FmdB family regulatory protein
MPIYEYMCVKCEHIFEEVVMADDAPECCPECGAEIKRIVSKPVGNVEYRDAKENYKNVIKKDVYEIVNKIKGGDEDALADIAGDNAVSAGAIKRFVK